MTSGLSSDSSPTRPHMMSFVRSYDLGGSEKALLGLMDLLGRDGWPLTLIQGQPDGPLARLVPGHVQRISARPTRHGLSGFLALADAITHAVRVHRPDILYCPGSSYTALALLVQQRLGAACPPLLCKVSNAVARADHGQTKTWLHRMWLRAQLRRFDGVIAMDAGTAEQLAHICPPARGRIHLLANPLIGPAMRQRLIAAQANPAPGKPGVAQVVCAARLVPQKDIATLLDAVAILRATHDVQLVLLGDGPQQAALEARARASGLAAAVRFVGEVADPLPWMASAQAVVLSSRYEGLPSALVEAMALGVPVVSTRASPGVTELLEGGRLGPLAPVGDAPALAEAIALALDHPVPAEQLRFALGRFDEDVVRAGFTAVCNALVRSASLAGG